MRKVMLITLSLVLALVGWTTVYAEDSFYVVAGQKANYAPVPKTGQTIPYVAGDDGTLQKGVGWPTPRFNDNGNGTVTDKLTGLIWTKNASCFGTLAKNWTEARIATNNLKSGDPGTGLTDGSKAGDWRLPNFKELQSLVDYGHATPALPEGNPFTGVQFANYWSSTTFAFITTAAWRVNFGDGSPNANYKSLYCYVWCVRGGK